MFRFALLQRLDEEGEVGVVLRYLVEAGEGGDRERDGWRLGGEGDVVDCWRGGGGGVGGCGVEVEGVGEGDGWEGEAVGHD